MAFNQIKTVWQHHTVSVGNTSNFDFPGIKNVMPSIKLHTHNFHESQSFMKNLKIKILANISGFIIHDVFYNIGVLRSDEELVRILGLY